MHNSKPLLANSDFPAIFRMPLINLGYRRNLSCVLCHVNAGPTLRRIRGY